EIDGQIHLCGLSLGGILTLNFALDFPQKAKSLVLIGTPHKVPKAAFGFQNIIFRFLPKSIFATMAFDKKDTFALGNTMKNLDFSDRVKNIKCPTLILCGKKDSANMKSAYYLSQNVKSAELKVIEDTGHVVNEENPKVLAEILNEYYVQNP
ncbi:MAG: alpha/beta hydrolase, partial [Lachnospiraceae bacterium]|nr:alpha/beta hydrolase [Lachnospiraceae bacterium]